LSEQPQADIQNQRLENPQQKFANSSQIKRELKKRRGKRKSGDGPTRPADKAANGDENASPTDKKSNRLFYKTASKPDPWAAKGKNGRNAAQLGKVQRPAASTVKHPA
jgi:hypothetical protein